MDEAQVDQIVVPLLVPRIASILAKCAAVLTGVGATLTVTTQTDTAIATTLVSLAFVVWHQFYQWQNQKAIAQNGYIRGAQASGVTLAKGDVPAVVNGPAPQLALTSEPVVVSPLSPTPATSISTDQTKSRS
jgi:hypothetical protein